MNRSIKLRGRSYAYMMHVVLLACDCDRDDAVFIIGFDRPTGTVCVQVLPGTYILYEYTAIGCSCTLYGSTGTIIAILRALAVYHLHPHHTGTVPVLYKPLKTRARHKTTTTRF